MQSPDYYSRVVQYAPDIPHALIDIHLACLTLFFVGDFSVGTEIFLMLNLSDEPYPRYVFFYLLYKGCQE